MNRQETGNMEVGDGNVVIRETETVASVQVKTNLGVTREREDP